MSEQVIERVETRLWVRVWFGSHVVAQYTATPDLAAAYAHAMSRRFAGLRVTSDPVEPSNESGRPLPPDRLWELPPH